MKALIVYGGWDGHEPGPVSELFEKELKGQGFAVTRRDTLEPLADEAAMKALDLVVVHWTMGKLTREQWAGLDAAVRGGTGLAGVHGGLGDAFREHTDFQHMVGGQFVAHPGNIQPYRVHVVDPGDPVMAGLGHFDVVSEQYYMHVDPSNHVLATTTCEAGGATMPVAWKRMWGKGRVFYSALGHVAKEFDVPEVRTLTVRGMVWAAEGKRLAR